MIQELLYTSAPRGLKPGSRGFCTVLSTQGMAAPLASALEGLSGYKPLYPHGHKDAGLNPIVHAHRIVQVAGRRITVLSRVADYGLDYSQRSNKIAHHLVLDPGDRPSAGPAWLLGQPGWMRTDWEGEPRIIPSREPPPNGDRPPGVCREWEARTGDAGWAGVLAEAFLDDPERLAFLVCPVALDPLPLLEEAISLLPAEKRWDVTFNTYVTGNLRGAICNWRCVLEDSAEAHQSRRHVRALRIDLTSSLSAASGGALVELARTGRVPATEAPSPKSPLTSPPQATATANQSPFPMGAPVRLQQRPPSRASAAAPPVRREGQSSERKPRRWWMVLLSLLLVAGAVAVTTLLVTQDRQRPVAALSGTPSELTDAASDGTPQGTDVNEPPSTPANPPADPDPASTSPPTENPAPAEELSDATTAEDPPAAEDGTTDTRAAPSPETDDEEAASDDANAGSEQASSDAATPPTAETIYFGLPEATPDAEGAKAVIEIDRFPWPSEREPQLSLLAPKSYRKEITQDASDGPANSLDISWIKYEGDYPVRQNLATFTLVRLEEPGGTYSLSFQWTGHRAHWDKLRWCVLRIHDESETLERRYVLHREGAPEKQNNALLAFKLPKHNLRPMPPIEGVERGPNLFAEPVTVMAGEQQVVFRPVGEDVEAGDSGINLTLDRPSQFAASFADFGFPELSQDTPLRFLLHASEESEPEIRLAPISASDLKESAEKWIDDRLARLPQEVLKIISSNPDKYQLRATAFLRENSVAQMRRRFNNLKGSFERWIKDELRAEKQKDENRTIWMDAEAEIERVFDESSRFRTMISQLENAQVERMRVYYIVTDEGGEYQQEVDVIRIPPAGGAVDSEQAKD